MIIRYHSKTPGTPLRSWDIERKSFELTDEAGNRWLISDADLRGLHIEGIEDSQSRTPELSVVLVSRNVLELETRP